MAGEYHFAAEGLGAGEGFGCFTGGDCVERGFVFAEAIEEGLCVVGGDGFVRDDCWAEVGEIVIR